MSIRKGENLIAGSNVASKIINQQDSTTQLKVWTGTKAQYEAIAVKASDTLYNITDDTTGVNSVTVHNYLFETRWSDHLIDDMSWLRADTFSWQSGLTYRNAYAKLLSEYNSGTTETEGSITFKRSPNGFKICDSSMESAVLSKYNSDGIAWYYIIDTTNTQFKLPRTKFGFEGLRGNVGDDIAESLPNIKGTQGTVSATSFSGDNTDGSALYGIKSGTYGAAGAISYDGSHTINFDASRSSSTYQDNAPVQERATQMYLYFYVGEFSQSAIEQTAGLNSELFNGKQDVLTATQILATNAPYLKTTYVNGTSGYRIWSDGYCEQWGEITTSSINYTVSFLKQFRDTNYQVYKSFTTTQTSFSDWEPDFGFFTYRKINSSSFTFYKTYNADKGNGCCWKVCGYLASGQY